MVSIRDPSRHQDVRAIHGKNISGIIVAGTARGARQISDSLKTPKPSASFDSQFEREQSQVRDRGRPTVPSPAPAGAVAPAPRRASATKPSETMAERTRRIEQKVSVASLLLQRLSPVDPRARLLSSAMLRRDEVLLDAVLSQLTEEVFALVRSR